MKGITVVSKSTQNDETTPKRIRIHQRCVSFIHFIEGKFGIDNTPWAACATDASVYIKITALLYYGI